MNTDTINSRLGENIKKIRTKKGMSQGDISSKIGADRAYISGIENGKRNVTLSTVAKLSEALGVSIEELMK